MLLSIQTPKIVGNCLRKDISVGFTVSLIEGKIVLLHFLPEVEKLKQNLCLLLK